jgi:hypothetical protein
LNEAILLEIKDPLLISTDTYQFIIEQAKERFEDLKTSSETITERAFKIMYAYVLGISGALAYFTIKKEDRIELSAFHIYFLVMIVVLCIICFYKLSSLLFPRPEVGRGFSTIGIIL